MTLPMGLGCTSAPLKRRRPGTEEEEPTKEPGREPEWERTEKTRRKWFHRILRKGTLHDGRKMKMSVALSDLQALGT